MPFPIKAINGVRNSISPQIFSATPELVPRFLGESREAQIRSIFEREGVIDSNGTLIQNGSFQYALAAEPLLKQILQVSINDLNLNFTVGELLTLYKVEYEKRGGRFISANLVGSRCPAILGTRRCGELLATMCPAATSLLHETNTSHMDEQVHDTDFHIDLTLPSCELGVTMDGILEHFCMLYWWKSAPFKVQSRWNIFTCFGFQQLLGLDLKEIKVIRTLKGVHLDEKIFLPQHLTAMEQRKEDGYTLAKEIFEELFHRKLTDFVAKTAFNEWHFFQDFQLHRLNCLDQEGQLYDFIGQFGSLGRNLRM